MIAAFHYAGVGRDEAVGTLDGLAAKPDQAAGGGGEMGFGGDG